ncbi:hypothetical protein J2810_002600 [Chryseobacterium rhizosphaerae]|nr:hypothetical protein [Chryseobacterium rhizosphaerae]
MNRGVSEESATLYSYTYKLFYLYSIYLNIYIIP